MILSPRQTESHDLPEAVQGLTVVNETIATVDMAMELQDGVLRIHVAGITLGKSAEAPQAEVPKVWKLG